MDEVKNPVREGEEEATESAEEEKEVEAVPAEDEKTVTE